MPQRAHALRVAPIFGPRYVAKLGRRACAWLLAIFRKLTATWHTWVFQQSLRGTWNQFPVVMRARDRLWISRHRAGPKLVCTGQRVVDGGRPRHPRALSCRARKLRQGFRILILQ